MSRVVAVLVRAGWVPARAEPSHRSEMLTQWLCGELLAPLEEREEWVRARGPDGYEGWCARGGLRGVEEGVAAAWVRDAELYCLGVELCGPVESAGAVRPWPRHLPWGGRVARAGEGHVRLPDGRKAVPSDAARLLDGASLRRRFPGRGDAVVETAAGWAGTPYLWGGRTRLGADCSGFVQAVYAAHGVGLPRDSGDQLAAGPGVDEAASDAAERRPGDLLFFGASRAAVTHVALSLGGTAILHAAAANGGVAADHLDALPGSLAGLPARLVGVTRPLELSPR
ncbi:MAG: SH3 domain-containing C40 family peptidase [Candidatus Palauibacterales bacterium]|nr:SH3 domain-containing C40 family peptidase [Candidatus Palauibacterales bacterium]